MENFGQREKRKKVPATKQDAASPDNGQIRRCFQGETDKWDGELGEAMDRKGKRKEHQAEVEKDHCQ